MKDYFDQSYSFLILLTLFTLYIEQIIQIKQVTLESSFIQFQKAACLFPQDEQLNNANSNNNADTTRSRSQTRNSPHSTTKKRDSVLRFSNHNQVVKQDQQQKTEPAKLTLSDLYPDMQLVKYFKQGDYFGEISLLTKQKRTATIVAEDDVQLLTITKKGFSLLLGTKQQSILKEKMKFLKQFAFFEILSNSRLLSLLHDIKEVTYPGNGAIIYKEDDPVNNFYIIKKGQVEISYKKVVSSIYEDKVLSLFKSPKVIKQQRVPLIIKGPNTYFGEEDFLLNSNYRTKCAKVLTDDAVFYVVNFKKSLYFSKIQLIQSLITNLKYFGGQIILADMFNIKSNWETQRITNIEETKDKCDKHKITRKRKPKDKNIASEHMGERLHDSVLSLAQSNIDKVDLTNIQSEYPSVIEKDASQFKHKTSILFRQHENSDQSPQQFTPSNKKIYSNFNQISNHSSFNNTFLLNKEDQIKNESSIYKKQNNEIFQNSFIKANNPKLKRLSIDQNFLTKDQLNKQLNKFLSEKSSPKFSQIQDFKQQDSIQFEKSPHYFNQNSNIKKENIPKLNFQNSQLNSSSSNFRRKTSDQEYLLKFKNLAIQTQPDYPFQKDQYQLSNRGNQSERKHFSNFFQHDRKSSLDISLSKKTQIQSFQNSQQDSIQKNFSDIFNSDQGNDKNSIRSPTNRQQLLEENKYEEQDILSTVRLFKSNYVNNAKDLVKQKKSFLHILKNKQKIGQQENKKDIDYFKLPQSLLKKCINTKRIVYKEFKNISYFEPESLEVKKHIEIQQQPQNNYDRVVKDLIKHLKTDQSDKQLKN